jgi:TolA-binding protein
MVTATEPQEPDESVEIIEPAVSEEEIPAEEPEAVESEPTGEVEAAPAEAIDGPVDTVAAPPPPPAAPQVDQSAREELRQHRATEEDRKWREQVGRQARSYEQQLQESGYMPEQARDQARRYVQQEQKFRKQEEEAQNMVGYLQGRQIAAVNYMSKYGLANKQVLDDLNFLMKSNSPGEMDKEAARMKNDRALRAENTRLKQGRVAPQAFDNSQGSAEATSNSSRLLDAYNAGDRSPAAKAAAKKLTLGS